LQLVNGKHLFGVFYLYWFSGQGGSHVLNVIDIVDTPMVTSYFWDKVSNPSGQPAKH
jgi:hypothetical protein